jgi:hypothetical protein
MSRVLCRYSDRHASASTCTFVTLTCAVGRFLKAVNHVKVRKMERDGTSDPFSKVRSVYVDSKIPDISIRQAFDYNRMKQ